MIIEEIPSESVESKREALAIMNSLLSVMDVQDIECEVTEDGELRITVTVAEDLLLRKIREDENKDSIDSTCSEKNYLVL